MYDKEKIIKAITEMNIDLLSVILDNDKSYMQVPKELFLEKLNSNFNRLKNKGISKFEKVIKGTCNDCNKGCGGYTFLTKNNDYLDLLFEEKNNEIIDLNLCSEFKNEEEITKTNHIYFSFKKDESKNYNPLSHISSLQKQVEIAVKEFDKFENKITDIKELIFWFNNNKKLYNSAECLKWDYNFVWSFLSICITIESFNRGIKGHNYSKIALTEYHKFENLNEEAMIDWLIKYEKNYFQFSYGYEKTKNWKKTNLILFKNGETLFETGEKIKLYNNVLLDITEYKKSIEFDELYNNHYNEYQKKYWPTKELFEVYGNFGIELSEWLSARGLYSEILKKYDIKPKEKLE